MCDSRQTGWCSGQLAAFDSVADEDTSRKKMKGFQAEGEDGVADGVESCSEGEDDEDTELTIVKGKEEALTDFEEDRLCAVSGIQI